MNKWLEPIELIGKHVTLTPLKFKHKDELVKAVSDGKLWELWYTLVPSAETIDGYIASALEQFEKGTSLAFVVIENQSGKIIGCTRFCRATKEDRRVEIGYTWYAKSYQRTAVNTECKYLMLKHAFETWQCIAVEFRTHWHNHQSRNAIARLGAKQDGILRNHRIMANGNYRDTVVFSIIEGEWPEVKQSLAFRLK
ncbi:MAG: GNAT family N-acetyltransferase [Gammaproteobacteria bacterium]|nr:GNAT family N-acetyltransferase [Gammaproteobacteria bacterium]MDH5630105.1 GNAT family N-acetyltransferase [Gammaproteobacteria bacterium]